MSISQAEVIVDRRQLKRRLIRWRILAVLAVLLALGRAFLERRRSQETL